MVLYIQNFSAIFGLSFYVTTCTGAAGNAYGCREKTNYSVERAKTLMGEKKWWNLSVKSL